MLKVNKGQLDLLKRITGRGEAKKKSQRAVLLMGPATKQKAVTLNKAGKFIYQPNTMPAAEKELLKSARLGLLQLLGLRVNFENPPRRQSR